MARTDTAGPRDAAIGRRIARLAHFTRHVLRRFNDDGCLAAAGALSYTTLVSLVPLLAISLAVLSAFPIFGELRDQALGFVFDAFVPRIGGTVEWYISYFAASAGKTTAIGIVVLAATSVMLLTTIEHQLDAIWRVNTSRRWVARITVYWTVLTLGPLLFGLALSISADLHGFFGELGVSQQMVLRVLRSLGWVVPGALETLGCTLFYCLIPHCPVRWRDGLLGGVVAAILLEICKAGFTLFIDHFNSYEAIYGALAVIPIFLLWMYLSWSIVLFGAEIAAAVTLWQIDETLAPPSELTDLELALRLLETLTAQSRNGGSATIAMLTRKARRPSDLVGQCLNRLSRTGFVAATTDGGFVLSRDLNGTPLGALEAALQPGRRQAQAARAKLAECFGPVRLAEEAAMSAPIAAFLDPQSDGV
jgi:membrane protein